MGNSCMTGADCGPTGSRTRIYLFLLLVLAFWDTIYSLWRDTLLSLGLMGEGFAPAQGDVVDIVDFLWEALPALRSVDGEVGWGEGRGSRRREGSGNWDWYVK